jgi:DNA-binding transcriptional MocR family regulator
MEEHVLIETIQSKLPLGRGPLFLNLASIISEEISQRNLPKGDKLPPYRMLSIKIGVSESTVQRAYRELERQCLIIPRTGDGSYVLGPAPKSKRSFSKSPTKIKEQPNGDTFVDLSQKQFMLEKDLTAWKKIVDLSDVDQDHLFEILNYGDEQGLDSHRDAGRSWITRYDLDVPRENIVCTNGAQHGLYLAMSVVMRMHDAIAVDKYTYPGILTLARRMNIRIVCIAGDKDGISPDDLEEKIRQNRISAVFLTPNMQNPLNYQMSNSRRDQIAEICKRHSVFIFEDETQGILSERCLKTFYERLPDQTVLVTSMSKIMASGLRVGHLVIPTRLRDRFKEAMKEICWMATAVSHEMAKRCVDSGFLDECLAKTRNEIERRKNILNPFLEGLEFASVKFSSHYWIALPEKVTDLELTEILEKRGVKVSPSSQFSSQHAQDWYFIRTCVTAYTSDDNLTMAFKKVREAILEREPKNEYRRLAFGYEMSSAH